MFTYTQSTIKICFVNTLNTVAAFVITPCDPLAEKESKPAAGIGVLCLKRSQRNFAHLERLLT